MAPKARINDRGTLLISTTNYPEAIDERVLKRPGRLDRMFIIPETRTHEDAEQMLRMYLGPLWQEAHQTLVPKFIGYPGAFVREVAVYALTQVAFDELPELPLALLEQSFEGLRDQIAARDDFLDGPGQATGTDQRERASLTKTPHRISQRVPASRDTC